ncbi:MAG: HNH endonuclease [Ignavibacterium sp.]|uniref:HNH endonuclease n=1 Tax=Ignavibacterium sp. TaxID=2651167 RepID=UPI0040490A53
MRLKTAEDFMEFGDYLQNSVQEYFPKTIREDYVQIIPGWSVFSVVTIPPKFRCYFREWGGNPFHYVIENKSRKLCQLDLTRVLEMNEHFSWYLAKPTNEFTKNIFDRIFEYHQKVPDDYRKKVKEQKKYLDSNPRMEKAGYLFAEDTNINELQEKFIQFIKTLYESVERRIELRTPERIGNIFELEDIEAVEGYREDKVYLYTTRNKDIVLKRKQLDDYTCQICGFKFELNGKKIIECHHLKPLSDGEARITKIDDLISVCPTCHRIIHLRKPPFSVEEVKQLLNRRK